MTKIEDMLFGIIILALIAVVLVSAASLIVYSVGGMTTPAPELVEECARVHYSGVCSYD